MLTAVILCGGEGTRIKHLTGCTPKCVVKFQDKPFLRILLNQLYQTELIENIIFLAANKRRPILDALWPRGKFRITQYDSHWVVYSDNHEHIFTNDPPRIGTAASLLYAIPFIKTNPVLVMNGDTLVEFSLKDMLEHHRSQITIAVVENSTDDTFEFIDTGVWLINRSIFDFLPTKIMNRETWARTLQGLRVKINNFIVESFIDIGTPEGFVRLQNK